MKEISNPTVLTPSLLTDPNPYQFSKAEMRQMRKLREANKQYSIQDLAKKIYFDFKKREIDYSLYAGILSWISNPEPSD